MKLTQLLLLVTVCVMVAFASFSDAKLKTGECEVCIKAINDFKALQEKVDLKDDNVIDENLRSWCATQKAKNERFCYYIGGAKTSATKMLKDVSIPLKNGLPAERICEKLKKTNPAICELRFDKKIDLSNLSKLRVKNLKKILFDWGEECKGCVEKSDYINLIESVRHKYEKQEL